jgi:DnaK suppressor protein
MGDDLNLDEFKRLLNERLVSIEQGRAALRQGGAPVELDQAKVGRLSRMDALQQQAMAQATARRNEQEIQRIHTALARLRSGDYGYCVTCDEDISPGRLLADPATLVCIDCARATEKR